MSEATRRRGAILRLAVKSCKGAYAPALMASRAGCCDQMSDGGSGGKQSPRGCAEYSVMLTKTSLSAHHWTFLHCSKKWFEEKYKMEKNGDFSDNSKKKELQTCTFATLSPIIYLPLRCAEPLPKRFSQAYCIVTGRSVKIVCAPSSASLRNFHRSFINQKEYSRPDALSLSVKR